MARKNWDEIAEQQFKTLPADYQDSWRELREREMLS
jgi:DNA-binding ferritin-like protein (Dps family)